MLPGKASKMKEKIEDKVVKAFKIKCRGIENLKRETIKEMTFAAKEQLPVLSIKEAEYCIVTVYESGKTKVVCRALLNNSGCNHSNKNPFYQGKEQSYLTCPYTK